MIEFRHIQTEKSGKHLSDVSFAGPVIPPVQKQVQLCFDKAGLTGAQCIGVVKVQCVVVVAKQHKQIFWKECNLIHKYEI